MKTTLFDFEIANLDPFANTGRDWAQEAIALEYSAQALEHRADKIRLIAAHYRDEAAVQRQARALPRAVALSVQLIKAGKAHNDACAGAAAHHGLSADLVALQTDLALKRTKSGRRFLRDRMILQLARQGASNSEIQTAIARAYPDCALKHANSITRVIRQAIEAGFKISGP